MRKKETNRRSKSNNSESKLRVIIAAVVAVILLGGYTWGKKTFTPERTMDQFEEALKAGDAEAVAKLVNDELHDGFEATAETVQPMLDYFEEREEERDKFINVVRGEYEEDLPEYVYGQIILTEKKKFFLFENYEVFIPTMIAELETSPGIQVSWNGKEIFIGEEGEESYTFGPFIFGEYTFTASGKIGDEDREVEKTFVLVDGYLDDIYYVDIEVASLDILADFESGDVFLDDEKIGELTNSRFVSDNLNYKEGMEVWASYVDADNNEWLTERQEVGRDHNVLYLPTLEPDSSVLAVKGLAKGIEKVINASEEITLKDVAEEFLVDGTADELWPEIETFVEEKSNAVSENALSNVTIDVRLYSARDEWDADYDSIGFGSTKMMFNIVGSVKDEIPQQVGKKRLTKEYLIKDVEVLYDAEEDSWRIGSTGDISLVNEKEGDGWRW